MTVPATAPTGALTPSDVDGAAWARLRSLAVEAMGRAYAPYSRFRVGAAGLVDDGRLVSGCNVENAGYGVTLCAECGLVSELVRTGGGRLIAFACVDGRGEPCAPCGRCRQVLGEHAHPRMLLAMPDGLMTIDEVLPGRFTRADLEAPGADAGAGVGPGGLQVGPGEPARQDLVDGHEPVGHGQEHARVGVLAEHLAAAPAGGAGLAAPVDAGEGDQPSSPGAHQLGHEPALGAQGHPVAGVLHIAARHQAPVVDQPGRADAEARVGRVGAPHGLHGQRAQSRPGGPVDVGGGQGPRRGRRRDRHGSSAFRARSWGTDDTPRGPGAGPAHG